MLKKRALETDEEALCRKESLIKLSKRKKDHLKLMMKYCVEENQIS